MEQNDLLSACLDECGLDFNDLEEIPTFNEPMASEQPKLQMLQALNVPDVKPPYESLFSSNQIYPPRIKLESGIQVKRISVTSTSQQSLLKPQLGLRKPDMISLLSKMPYMPLPKPNSLIDPLNQFNNQEEELADDDDDEFAQADTFADYMPTKLKIGLRHPDPVVETSSLASVLPPDVWFRLHIPEEVIDEGKLSALQLEAIVYACQQHEHFLSDGCRSGFLVGDGAGVGKGRTIAGIIYENFLQGRKRAVWLSVSNDLKYDAERDFFDIGASKIDIHLLNKFKYGHKIHSSENNSVKRGVIFSTYSSLISESSTHNSGKYGSRFKQLIQWCGEDFEGVIVFDECHKAKNLFPSGSGKPTKTGLAVLELQNQLPKARIVYASATGATEPKNMGYITRLGVWGKGTPFDDFMSFVTAVEKRGVGAMELVAIDLKMRGMYMARQLSFKGVNFRIEEVPLSADFIKLYDKCTQLWVEAKIKFDKALDLMGSENGIKKSVWTQFWASHQRFFKYLCIASKVKFAVELAKEALRDDKCVVIGLQSTGEARTLEQLDECGGELNDFVSTAKAVFQSLIEKHFPAPNRKKLLRILGEDTSFFDELGLSFKRNSRDEIVGVSDANTKGSDSNASTSSMKNKNNRNARSVALKKKKSETNGFSDSASGSDDSDKEDESDFEPSEADDESEDFSEGTSDDEDDDQDMDDDDDDDGESRRKKKRKRKSNFANIFLNTKPKKQKTDGDTKSKMRKEKEREKNKLMKDEMKDLNIEVLSEEASEACTKMRDEMMEKLEKLSDKLPPNTLDELIDDLGGPENVAEMTGRKGRVVSNSDGTIQYEARTENDVSLEMLNLVEKQRFMDDKKRVAIISEAASSGISLHSDKRAKNRHRRMHITVELPWSADRAIQQFGRTHRSNQVTAPEYVFLISDLAGEQRFASIVAKRLESLGALTHGDRRAGESRDLSKFNIDNKYGRQALEAVMKSIVGLEQPLVKPPEDYRGDFMNDCLEGLIGVGLIHEVDRKDGGISYNLDKDHAQMSKFLNRLLGLEFDVQNGLFKYFSDTMDAVIKQAKRAGRYDSGIIELSSEVGKVNRQNEESFLLKSSSGVIKIQLHTVAVDRGMTWESAYDLWLDCKTNTTLEGFYIARNSYIKCMKNMVFLAVADTTNRHGKHIFRIYKPNQGLQPKFETISSLKEKGRKVLPDEVESVWKEIYKQAETQCQHSILFGKCRRVKDCEIGVRKKLYCILSGAVLTVWPELEKNVLALQNRRLQIVRLKTDDGLKFIGPMIPPSYVDVVKQTLRDIESGRKEGASATTVS